MALSKECPSVFNSEKQNKNDGFISIEPVEKQMRSNQSKEMHVLVILK